MSAHEVVFDPPIDGGIVVGHDGSASSDRALAWGVREATLHGSALHVVRAWSLITAAALVKAPFGVVPSFDECAAAVRQETTQALQDTLAQAGDPVLDAQVHVVHADPGDALVAASRTAEVVIVGHRGHGGRLDAVLGSVAEHVLRHATSPVAVLRTR